MSSSGAPWVSQVSHVNSVISGYRVTLYQPAVNIEISVNEPRVSKAPSDVSVCKWGSLKPHLHIGRHQGIYSNYFDGSWMSTVRSAVRMGDPIKVSNDPQVGELEDWQKAVYDVFISWISSMDISHYGLTCNGVWLVKYHSDRYFCNDTI